jgi:Ala-tRNA(Pro) deacylase
MPVKRLKEFLDKEGVAYVVISHSPAYTAQGVAKAARLSGNALAKVVVVKINGNMGLAVLPAPCKIDLGHLKTAVKASSLEIATEEEFKNVFPDCDLGAMPPFGNLYPDAGTPPSSDGEWKAFRSGFRPVESCGKRCRGLKSSGLHKMDVYVDASIAKEKEMIFNAGSHKELIRLAYKDFKRLVRPKVVKFSFVTL